MAKKKKAVKKAKAKKSAKKEVTAKKAKKGKAVAKAKTTVPSVSPIIVSAEKVVVAPPVVTSPAVSVPQTNPVVASTPAPTSTVKKEIPQEMTAMITNLKRIITSYRYPMRKYEVRETCSSISSRLYKTEIDFGTGTFSIKISDQNGNSWRLPEKESATYPLGE
jgi:hypothetical protein